jgi:hypothetical protein
MTYLLLLIIAVGGYVIYNLLKKVEKYEQVILDNTNTLTYLHDTIVSINTRLNEIDHRGTFESDDEVGFFFKEIKNMQSTLNQYIEHDASEEEKPR